MKKNKKKKIKKKNKKKKEINRAECQDQTGPKGQNVRTNLRASSVLTLWPFGPVWSLHSDPSGQFDPDILIWANLVLM